jgi:general secretion pathway protein I
MRDSDMGRLAVTRIARGFTLIEVMVALVVVALGMTAVIQAVGDTASNSAYLREKTIAHWIAMNKLTELRLLPTAPKVAKTSDDIEMAGRNWRWTMDVQATPVDTVRRIDVTVRPKEAGEKTSLASVTGFYGTAIAPPGMVQTDWSGVRGGGAGQFGGDNNQNNSNDNNNGGNRNNRTPQTPPSSPGDDSNEPSMPDPSEDPTPRGF